MIRLRPARRDRPGDGPSDRNFVVPWVLFGASHAVSSRHRVSGLKTGLRGLGWLNEEEGLFPVCGCRLGAGADCQWLGALVREPHVEGRDEAVERRGPGHAQGKGHFKVELRIGHHIQILVPDGAPVAGDVLRGHHLTTGGECHPGPHTRAT